MKTRFIILLLVALGGVARAQYDPLNAVSVQSMSGQFTITSPGVSPLLKFAPLKTNDTGYIQLDADRLAVATERVKEAVWRELGVKDVWQGKVTIALRSDTRADEPITIVTERFRNGWNYHLEMPDVRRPSEVVRALVNVVLLERANRRAAAPGDHPAELPEWFTEGMTQQLLASANYELIPRQPVRNTKGGAMASTFTSGVMKDPLEGARALLQTHPQLTFQQLSWPGDVDMDSDAGASFRACAQLFVAELLELPKGQERARQMIDKLADYYNWQTAFLTAYAEPFPRLLDVEKWWALKMVNVTRRDPARFLTTAESWSRLEEIMRTPVQVRHLYDQLPVRREASLQRVIQELDYPRQKQTIQAKLQQLAQLRLRVAPELGELLDDYRNVLSDYLHRREKAGGTLVPQSIVQNRGTVIVSETVGLLDQLDARRAALSPKPVAVIPRAGQPVDGQ